MNKLKLWVKRPVNINFIFFMGVALFFAVFAFIAYSKSQFIGDSIDSLGEWIDNTNDGNVDDVEGYGIIFGTIAYGLGSIGNFLLILLLVIVPLFLSLSTAVQAIFVRLLYHREKSGRLLCYRVFNGILLASTLFAFIFMTYIATVKASASLIVGIADIIALVMTVICIKNTYTDKIKE